MKLRSHFWLVCLPLIHGFTAAIGAAPMYVNLPTVMKLAGAKNDEIELARVRHVQTIAQSKQAWQKFWPSFSLGVNYRRQDGNVQDIAGAVFDVSKQQYSLGPSVLVDWSPGEIYYSALAAKQRSIVAEHLVEKSRQDIVLQATGRYYDLLGAEALLAMLEEDLRLTQDYEKFLSGAVEAGTAFRADLLKVKNLVSRSQLGISQQKVQRDLAAAALAETLRLPPATELRPAKADLVPVRLISLDSSTKLVEQGLENRPEIRVAEAAQAEAALETKRSKVAPLIPNLQAGYTAGGLGGGFNGDMGNFDDTQSFFIGFGWKIGPGGLFDRQRKIVAETQEQAAQLQRSQIQAAIGREVVSAIAQTKSAREQITISEEAVNAAQEMVKLARERQSSGLGVVLEYILARDELTKARTARVQAVTDYNKAQHALKRAIGR